MLDKIRTKIRALILDLIKSDFEPFTYVSSPIWKLAQDNIQAITSVEKNGVAIGSGDYDYDSSSNKITITISLSAGDSIVVYYTYFKYSDTELDETIRASLVWMSIFGDGKTDFEVENDDIYPHIDNKDSDLVAIIGSILLKPSYSQYILPNVTIRYPEKMSKDEKIQKLIRKYKFGSGISGVLDLD